MRTAMHIDLQEVSSLEYVQEIFHTARGERITDMQYFCCNLVNGEFIEIGTADARFEPLKQYFSDALKKLPADEAGSLIVYEAVDNEGGRI